MRQSFILLIAFLICMQSIAQNLFDAKHSKEFAEFLVQTRQFEFAAREYERVLIYDKDESVKLSLLKSYRLSNNLLLAQSRLNDLYPELNKSPLPVFEEAIKIKMKAASFEGLTNLINENQDLNHATRNKHLNMEQFLKLEKIGRYKLKESHELINIPGQLELQLFNDTYEKYLEERWKSPVLAASMSAVIPGSGRLYAGDWKNAIVSLLFVGINTFQSYKGFSTNGISSPSGWIFGAIALGFYTGNIYGSAWTAKRKNTQKYERYKKNLESIYFID